MLIKIDARFPGTALQKKKQAVPHLTQKELDQVKAIARESGKVTHEETEQHYGNDLSAWIKL